MGTRIYDEDGIQAMVFALGLEQGSGIEIHDIAEDTFVRVLPDSLFAIMDRYIEYLESVRPPEDVEVGPL